MDYGQRLRALRESRNLSQQDLADKLKINRSTYARYELSQTQPDFDTLQNLANFFEVTTDYLLSRSDIKNPEKKPEGRFFYDLENASKEDLEDLEEFYKVLQRRKATRKNRDQ